PRLQRLVGRRPQAYSLRRSPASRPCSLLPQLRSFAGFLPDLPPPPTHRRRPAVVARLLSSRLLRIATAPLLCCATTAAKTWPCLPKTSPGSRCRRRPPDQGVRRGIQPVVG